MRFEKKKKKKKNQPNTFQLCNLCHMYHRLSPKTGPCVYFVFTYIEKKNKNKNSSKFAKKKKMTQTTRKKGNKKKEKNTFSVTKRLMFGDCRACSISALSLVFCDLMISINFTFFFFLNNKIKQPTKKKKKKKAKLKHTHTHTHKSKKNSDQFLINIVVLKNVRRSYVLCLCVLSVCCVWCSENTMCAHCAVRKNKN